MYVCIYTYVHIGVKQDAIQQSGQARWNSRQSHSHYIYINIHVYTYMHICNIYMCIYVYIHTYVHIGVKPDAIQ